jgi:hypothetical protein
MVRSSRVWPAYSVALRQPPRPRWHRPLRALPYRQTTVRCATVLAATTWASSFVRKATSPRTSPERSSSSRRAAISASPLDAEASDMPSSRARARPRACTGGDKASCADLGFVYRFGKGVARDGKRAAVLFEEACSANVLAACAHLGAQLAQRRGGPPRARSWARIAREELYGRESRRNASLTPSSAEGASSGPRAPPAPSVSCDARAITEAPTRVHSSRIPSKTPPEAPRGRVDGDRGAVSPIYWQRTGRSE